MNVIMFFHRIGLAGRLLSVVLPSFGLMSGSPHHCTFSVEIVDLDGRSIEPKEFEVELKRADASLYKFSNLETQPLTADCGDYDIWVRNANGPDGRYFFGRFPLWSTHRDVRLALVPGELLHQSGPTGIKGEVKGVRRQPIWIRLVPQFDNMTPVKDLILTNDGDFEFFDINPGRYVLLFMRQGELLTTRQTSVYTSEVSDISTVTISPGPVR